MKVIYITTAPAPYKVEMLEILGTYCDLDVVFEKNSESYREDSWLRTDFKNFKAHFLKGIRIKDSIISWDIISLIKKNRYDCIIVGVYSTPSELLSQVYFWIHKIPYVLSSDGGFVKKEKRIAYLIKTFFISKATYYLSPNESSSTYLMHYGARKENIYLYPFSSVKESEILSSPDSFEVRKAFKEKNRMSEKYSVLFVGQIIPRKGIDILIKSAKRLSDIGVYLVGGSITEEYKRLIEQFDITNIHFIGFKDKNNLADYYRASDVFVLPTREDVWGLVVNEAMSFGLPVITTSKCNAGIEMIKNENVGTILKNNNEKELADSILSWVNKRNKDNDEEVLSIAKMYTIEKCAFAHYEIIKKLFGEGNLK
ncbi:glycosyltransferase family 4 protein [Butyrivibrio sp. INlla14]|uniref:glycosyltransferase family 4 protein n=1 Tax=Butyrivibrio sp. INlla14 TaxID=1520808 RepID=UPI0008763465|nr:glycosyltransferase family 4 protein [Butyrivibrio sp. INlla14]SCY50857.1 Glycosyltransferase involved in cell wall bisynthesis [Butyrivibrio sp. INlla14]